MGNTDDPILVCPKCGYNLTGTDSPQCPECGAAVDRGKLAAEQAKAIISGGQIWKRMLITAGIGFLASTIPVVSMYVMPPVALILLIHSGVSSWDMANRLALTRAVMGKPEGAGYRAFVGWTFVGLWLAHIVLTAAAIAGGCAIAVGILISSIH